MSPSGRLLALADDHKQVTLWDVASVKCLHQWNAGRRANSLTFTADEKFVVTADKTGDVFQFDCSGEQVRNSMTRLPSFFSK